MQIALDDVYVLPLLSDLHQPAFDGLLCCNLCELSCLVHLPHVPESNSGLVLALKTFVFLLVVSFQLSPLSLIRVSYDDSESPSHPVLISSVAVSVTWMFSGIGLLALCLTPNLEDQLVSERLFPSPR